MRRGWYYETVRIDGDNVDKAAFGTIAALFAGFVLVGSGAAIGGIAEVSSDPDGFDNNEAAAAYVQELRTINNQYEASVKENVELEPVVAALPQSCIALIEPYAEGNVLEEVPQSDAVQLILESPGQPCGDEPVEINISLESYSRYFSNSEFIEAAPLAGGDYNTSLETYEHVSAEVAADMKTDAPSRGAVIGMGLLGVLWAGHLITSQVSKRRSPRAKWKW